MKKQPSVIDKFVSRVQQFIIDPTIFPALAFERPYTKGDRLMRSERREAVGLVLAFLGKHCDIVSRYVGRPPDENGVMVGYGLDEIAHDCGLHISRVERAMFDLNQMGAVITIPRCLREADQEAEDGRRYVGLPALRRISLRVFLALGLGADYRDAKRNRTKKQKKTDPEPTDQRSEIDKANHELARNAAKKWLKRIKKAIDQGGQKRHKIPP